MLSSTSAVAAAAESAPVTSLAGRLVLTALVLLVAVGVLFLMRRSWRRRARSQSDIPDLPAVPPADVLTPLGDRVPVTYLGSVTAGAWLDRIAAHQLANRGLASVQPCEQGLLVERDGATTLFLPRAAVSSVRLDRGLAGRVYGAQGIIVVSWLWGDRPLESGLRVPDPAARQALFATLDHWLSDAGGHASRGIEIGGTS